MMNSNRETSLPPGFRFHPTDEELILHYLRNRATSLPCPVSIIADVDIYKFDPWDLPAKSWFGEKEWYFFTPRDRKYPNGARPNRAAASGYWKATGTDKPIMGTSGATSSECIGVKKALVFYKGRPPKGFKTNWIMHEYRLAETAQRPVRLKEDSMRLDDWVLCRIYKKSIPPPTVSSEIDHEDHYIEDYVVQERSSISRSAFLPSYHHPSIDNSLHSLVSMNNLSSTINQGPICSNEFVSASTSKVIDDVDSCSNQWLPSSYPSSHVTQNDLKRERANTCDSYGDDFLHMTKKYNELCSSSGFLAQVGTQQDESLDQALYNQVSLSSLLDLQ